MEFYTIIHHGGKLAYPPVNNLLIKMCYNVNMKKKNVLKLALALLTVIQLLTGVVFNVQADEEPLYLEVLQDDVRVRTGPGTNYAILQVNGENQYYLEKVKYEVITKEENDSGELWYQVKNIINGEEYHTWVRSDFILLHYYEEDSEFEQYLTDQGFPETYKEYLRYLHTAHPNWIFKAYHTGLTFEEMLDSQDVLGKNLIDGNNLALRSTAEGAYDKETGQFIALDGYSWYQANRATIAYYLDPRNFLNEEDIFQFSKLSFNENEKEDIIQNVLNGTFMSGNVEVSAGTYKAYSTIFYESGQNANVSPLYLATLARQEQGVSGSAATDGREFEYNGVTYKGYYNFFNIHAYSGTDNWKKGLVYAATPGSYERPWDSIEKSIRGGALWIADGYINDGQDTMYYQKFNCVTKQYWHQYMTNVRAAYQESSTLYSAYSKGNALDSSITFSIPIYEDMPEKTELPTTIEYPKKDEDENKDHYTGDIIVDWDLKNEDGYLSGFEVGKTYKDLKDKIELMGIDSYIKIYEDDQEVSDDTLIASGQNLKIYDKDGNESNYTVIIKGDLNGDGIIGTSDYLIYRKTLLGIYDISDLQLKCALFNGQEEMNTSGYLKLRKYLLGIGEIEQ